MSALAEVNGCGRSGSAVRGVAGIKILFQLTIFPVVSYRFSGWVLTYSVPVSRHCGFTNSLFHRGFVESLEIDISLHFVCEVSAGDLS